MNKILFLVILFCLNFSLYGQELVGEKILYESVNNTKFPFPEGIPPVVDLGEKGFVINVDEKIIHYDNDFNKKWEIPEKLLVKNIKGIYIPQADFVSNKTSAFKIIQWLDVRYSSPAEISVASYRIADGKVSNKSILLPIKEGTKISKFFAQEDGLYFFKVDINSKAKIITHYLGKVELEKGTISEKKLDLTYSAEELKSILSSSYPDEYVYKVYNIDNEQIRLMRALKDYKTNELIINLGSIDKEGKYVNLTKSAIPVSGTIRSYTTPVAVIDTLNKFIYVSGYLIGSTGFKGIYFCSYSLETGKTIASKMLFFDKINSEYKPSQKLDENIMFAETGQSNGFYVFHKINLRPDIYNNLLQVTLVRRNDAVLAGGYRYIYLNSDGKVTDIVRILDKKKNLEKTELYTDKSRKLKIAVDFYEAHYPMDKKNVTDQYIFRKDYMILFDIREFKSKITAYKLTSQL